MLEQSIRFASVNGRRVAWAAAGEGPPLVIGGWWMSHLELDWEDARFREFVSVLAEQRTVIRYDRPGTGLSGAKGLPPGGLGEEVSVLAAVVDLLDAREVSLFGGSAGGPVAVAFATGAPDRVDRLVLYGSYATGSRITDESSREAMISLVRDHWGLGSRVLADVFMPTATAVEREAFVNYQRRSAPAETAARSLEGVYRFDVEALLASVRAPTVVIHRRDDRAIPIELGRELAERIPGASFVPLEGADHLPWHGNTHALARAVLAGLGARRPPRPDASDAGGADAAGASAAVELSPRELQVLRLVAQGQSDREIAESLVLSPHTVHRHVANIRAKLRLPSRAAAAAYAAREGLV